MPGFDTSFAGMPEDFLFGQTVVGSSQASFDIQNIPTTFVHLRIIVSGRSASNLGGDDQAVIRFNNDSSAIYDFTDFEATSSVGANASTSATSGRIGFVADSSSPAGAIGGIELMIWDYLNTSFHKHYRGQCMLKETNSVLYTTLNGGVWKSTAAVNRVTVFLIASNWDVGSRISVYGVPG